MTQVLTITLNPAIDQTIPVKKLIPGAVHRILHGRGTTLAQR